MSSWLTAIQTLWQSLPPNATKYFIHAFSCALSFVIFTLFVDLNDDGDLETQRERILSKLWDLHTGASESNSPELEESESLKLQIIPWDLTGRTNVDVSPALNPASYFKPLSHEYIQEHPVDLSIPENCEMMETTARLLRPDYSCSTSRYEPIPSYGKAQILSHRLTGEMEAPRMNFPLHLSKLKMGTKWRWDTDFRLGPAFDREASGRADGYNSGIDTFWACANSPTFPHIKVVTYHDDVEHPERLLEAELMVLAATMHSRLGMETLTDHAIVPTMLFSFIGTSVRILIAIHDGSCLRISKSDLMSYSEESDELWSLLVRYLAGGINGELSTHKLPSMNAAEK